MTKLPGYRQHVFVVLLAAFVAGCAGSSPRYTGRGASPTIRVLVAAAQRVTAMTPGAYEVRAAGITILRGPGREELSFRVSGPSSIEVTSETAGVAAADGPLEIVTRGNVEVRGTPYAGAIVVASEGGVAQLINRLPLETYLEGVLPNEIGTPGPDAYAALEAQAVTARTYALTRIQARASKSYHVEAGVGDQVYGGLSKVNRLTSAAVKETYGVVLTHGGRLSGTYYSACCGGHTADIRVTWPTRESARYLYGVADSDGDGAFCSQYKRFRWRYSFTGRELGAIVRRTIPNELHVPASRVGRLVDVRITGRDPTGRVRRLEVETTLETFSVEADRIRWVLMPDVETGRILPSTMFDIEKKDLGGMVSFVSISGGGNGHGVGMCQNGALAMARKGYTYDKILDHYYPGTQIKQQY